MHWGFRTSGCAALAALLACTSSHPRSAPSRPNVVLLLADDLGYGDLACFGHPEIRTPNLDRLASEGMRLTSCYSAGANCSPSRTGLMTGLTPARAGVHNWIPFGSPMHLRAGETTVAGRLADFGYATCLVGKWHLNGLFNLPGQPQPGDHGFRHWFATQNNALPRHLDPDNFVRNGQAVGPQKGVSSALVAAEAVQWLRGRDPRRPFFLYVAFHEPHEPIATEPRFSQLYSHPEDPSRAAYYGNVTQMDDAVGRVLGELDAQGLRDATFVLFTSDNGPARTKYHNVGSSGPFREFKGHLYEGGIRVPGIVRWPGRVRAGSTSDEPVSGVDFLPTVCEITGVSAPPDRALDGVSVVPIFEGHPVRRPMPLYWQFLWAQSRPKVALRAGDWKILAGLSESPPDSHSTEESNRALKGAELQGFELYDLRRDAGETLDLSAREPAKLAEVTELLRQKFLEVRGEAPVWPPFQTTRYESDRIRWPDYVAKPRPAAQPR